MSSDIIEIVEGKTRIRVPNDSLTQKVPPMEPAFFNPNGIRLDLKTPIVVLLTSDKAPFATPLAKRTPKQSCRYKPFSAK